MKQGLRIAVAAPIFPNLVQTYVLSQLAKFSKDAASLTIFANTEQHYDKLPAIITDHGLMDRVTYTRVGLSDVIKAALTLLIRPSYWRTVYRLLTARISDAHEAGYRFKCIIRARAIDIDNIDIIHSHSLFSSYHLLFLNTVFDIPLVATYHGQVPQGIVRLNDTRQQLVLDTCDLFFVNTEFAKRELVSIGCDGSKIRILPQGTILDDYPYHDRQIDRDETIILLTVGRLSPEKGQHVVIDALVELVTEFPDIEYHVAGHGPCADALKQQAVSNGVQDNVVFHGFTSNEDLLALYRRAHIFILPSIDTGDGYHIETQGVVLQEAQASGIVVIGSRTGGIPEVIIDGETGLTFDESESTQLAGCIHRLITDPQLYLALQQNASEDIKTRFDIEVIGDNQLATYHQIIDSTGQD